ncbi:MAG: hypothetical protein H7308_19750 [Chthonomonadaceae bacterium]|nr:hypothetical protein [Chthonomonadaceae bacterium]
MVLLEEFQQKEWSELTKHAMERLRKGNTPDLARVRQCFQILVMPSFEDHVSWEVCHDDKAEAYFAVCSIWRVGTDVAKLETPIVRLRHPRPLFPTIEVEQFPLQSEWAEIAIASLKSLSISAMPDSKIIGLDGTFYELAFDAGFFSARYRWWSVPPFRWRPLDDWFQETLSSLEKLK